MILQTFHRFTYYHRHNKQTYISDIAKYFNLTLDAVNTSGRSEAVRTQCGERGSAGESGRGWGRGLRRGGGGGGRSHSWPGGESTLAKRRMTRRMMMDKRMRMMTDTRSLTPEVCTQGGRGRWCPDDPGVGRGHCLVTPPRYRQSRTPRPRPWPRVRAP